MKNGQILNFCRKNGGIIRPRGIFSKHFRLIHLAGLRVLKHFPQKKSPLSLFIFPIFSLLFHLVSSLVLLILPSSSCLFSCLASSLSSSSCPLSSLLSIFSSLVFNLLFHLHVSLLSSFISSFLLFHLLVSSLLLSRLLFSCLVLSLFLCLSLSLSVSLCLSLSLSVSLCLSLSVSVSVSLSPCGAVLWCCVVCCVVLCVWCGVLCVVWCVARLGTQKKPPCVDSKRPRVYRHHAHMCYHMRAWCQYTRGRFEPTHGGF